MQKTLKASGNSRKEIPDIFSFRIRKRQRPVCGKAIETGGLKEYMG